MENNISVLESKSEDQFDSYSTKRVISDELEEILYKSFKVLDKGFIRVIDYMGNDSSIVQAARVSYGKGTKYSSKDQGLINYLMRNRHTTPFEMCEIKLHVKLPIFIARQWIRHRTANVNEYSARYSIVEDEFYIPEIENVEYQSQSNAQGREGALPREKAVDFIEQLKKYSVSSYDEYKGFLDNDIARELARINLGLNYYTQWYWKVDLHNLLHFVRLRVDEHAQYEIREYAKIMLDLIKKWVPMTYNAFVDYSLNSYNFSEKGLNVIKQLLNGIKLSQEESGMSKREWDDLVSRFDITN